MKSMVLLHFELGVVFFLVNLRAALMLPKGSNSVLDQLKGVVAYQNKIYYIFISPKPSSD